MSQSGGLIMLLVGKEETIFVRFKDVTADIGLSLPRRRDGFIRYAVADFTPTLEDAQQVVLYCGPGSIED